MCCAESKADEAFSSLQVLVKELDDVLLRDVGDRIRNSSKFVTLIHFTLSTFF